MLVWKAVLPDFSPLAISRVFQYEITGFITSMYPVKAPIRPHSPNSSGVKRLVTIIVKISPVKTLPIPTANDIKPEYVTLIPDNLF